MGTDVAYGATRRSRPSTSSRKLPSQPGVQAQVAPRLSSYALPMHCPVPAYASVHGYGATRVRVGSDPSCAQVLLQHGAAV
eukprot:3865286-Rhodomonas_salina.2